MQLPAHGHNAYAWWKGPCIHSLPMSGTGNYLLNHTETVYIRSLPPCIYTMQKTVNTWRQKWDEAGVESLYRMTSKDSLNQVKHVPRAEISLGELECILQATGCVVLPSPRMQLHCSFKLPHPMSPIDSNSAVAGFSHWGCSGVWTKETALRYLNSPTFSQG